jgi:hypothetical protein
MDRKVKENKKTRERSHNKSENVLTHDMSHGKHCLRCDVFHNEFFCSYR